MASRVPAYPSSSAAARVLVIAPSWVGDAILSEPLFARLRGDGVTSPIDVVAPRVVVRDALVVWNDEFRNAPQLILDHVDFRLERRFGRVRLGLTGAPPAAVAAPLDLRADLSGASLGTPSGLSGRIYLRLDYADLAAWSNWIPLPVRIERGEGALRMWVDLRRSLPARAVADVEVHDLRATLDSSLAPLALRALSGRVTWTQDGDRRAAHADHLALTLPDGVTMASGRVDVAVEGGESGGVPHGRLALDRVELAPLAEISAHLPLPTAWRETITALAPRGTLAETTLDWTGDPARPETFAGSTRFADLSLAAHGAWPGVDGLSGRLDADQDRGTLAVSGVHASVALPAVFAAPIALDSVSGRIEWNRRDAPLEIKVDAFAFANADGAGTATATWRDDGSELGRASVSAKLTRAKVSALARYLPSSVPASVHAWLRHALAGGNVTAATLELEGDLAEFPFRDGRGGRFALGAHVQDATLAYADDWPSLTGIAADLRFADAGFSIDASRAQVLGARIDGAHAELRDLTARDLLLSARGTASGATASFLDFVAKSPVAEWTDHVTDRISTSGDAQLTLGLDLPLGDGGGAAVAGTLSLAANSLRIEGAPPIDALFGDLRFSQQGIDAGGLSGELLGGPAVFTLAGRGAGVTLAASGSADLARLRDAFGAAGLDRVRGRAPWKLDARLRNGAVEWNVDASLADAVIDLPAPLAKRAGVPAALRILRSVRSSRSDRLIVDCTLADPLHAVIDRRDDGEGLHAERVQVVFGKLPPSAAAQAEASTDPTTAGTDRIAAEADRTATGLEGNSVRGSVTTLDADGWLALLGTGELATVESPTGAPAVWSRLDLDAGTLLLAGRPFSRTRVAAVRAGDRWQVTLTGHDVDGHLTWQPAGAGTLQGRMVARLERLALPKAPDSDAPRAVRAAKDSERAAHWPALDLEASTFVSHGHTLGALAIKAEPDGSDWKIGALSIANDAGRIDAHGLWRATATDPTTTLEGEVDVKEAGAFMARFGWPDVVKGAASKIAGRIAWNGSPADFDYASLSGSFTLDAAAGQFTKIEPGVGRLLGVLSLQALPRRIGLDFRDVFSQGFAFDKATGKVTMHEGIMRTNDLRLTGPSAVVDIAGDADLARETQQLKVKVEPALASGVSAGAAALFLANPLVGAAVGAGTLLAQKLLNNPVDQLFSYEYLVSGSWDDPVVTRAGAAAAARSQVPVR